jgi:NAD(P)-dependent dehydrogenase (short-subunit alcohol dehydrogenase family)
MDLALRGKRAVVTGASQGIGEGIAAVLAEEGCHLHLVARSAEKLEIVAARLRAEHGVEVTVQQQDMGATKAAEAISHAAGNTDILVNNAGDIPSGDLWTVDSDSWRRGFDVKVYGYIDMCRVFYAKMKERGSGVIINCIGSGAEKPDFNYVAGCTGNAALNMFTRALGGKSLDDGIRVIGVNPGPTQTDRVVKIAKSRARDRWGDESRYTDFLAAYPLGRPAHVREVADVFAFLASPRSNYTSGTIVTIDGGIVSRRSLMT